jgi:hypothetical protein
MINYDHSIDTEPDLVEQNSTDDGINPSEEVPSSPTTTESSHKMELEKFLPNFIHVIQFCYLCSKGKIPPVHYKLPSSDEAHQWFSYYTLSSCGLLPTQ